MKKGMVGVLGTVVGAIGGIAAASSLNGKHLAQRIEKIDKFKGYYNMLNQWLVLKQEGKTLEQYFVDNTYNTIAIYGMGEMGNRLYDELKNSDKVEVKCTIDKNAAITYSELEALETVDGMPEVDVVVVTATFAFAEIEEELRAKIDYPIVSLDDVVYGI